MAFETVKSNLEKNGFTVSVFATKEEAAAYLNEKIDNVTVGMGGSMTLTAMGLKDSLSAHNVLFSHGYTHCAPPVAQKMAATADVYLLSANGISESTGEILNIDGIGLTTVADSFAAIEKRVVEEKRLTWDELYHALGATLAQLPPVYISASSPSTTPPSTIHAAAWTLYWYSSRALIKARFSSS